MATMASKRTAAAKIPKVPMGSKVPSTRKHPRAMVNLMIDYQTLDQFFHDYATNISLGGVFIRSRNPLPVGTKLKVSFSLPGLTKMVETVGEVAHVLDERAREGFCGMGIRFSDLDPKSKKIVDSLVGEQIKLESPKKASRKN